MNLMSDGRKPGSGAGCLAEKRLASARGSGHNNETFPIAMKPVRLIIG
jgi:hypothetical protein